MIILLTNFNDQYKNWLLCDRIYIVVEISNKHRRLVNLLSGIRIDKIVANSSHTNFFRNIG